MDSITANQNSITYVTGELGVGKSTLLEEINKRLNKNTRYLVGFYGEKETMIGESPSPIYPFICALDSVVKMAIETEKFKEKIEGTTRRLERAFKKYANERSTELVGAILHDVANRFGLNETLEEVKHLIKDIKSEKSSLALAIEYAYAHSDEPVSSYVGVIQSLIQEFKDLTFVLIFDQFESVRKASIDFLLNFLRRMQYSPQFHVIVSFTVETEKWSDLVALELYSWASRRLNELHAKELKLEGLSAEGIGEWITDARNQVLESNHLRKIREISSGLPVLLKEWIPKSEKFDYNDIDRRGYCSYVHKRRESLNSNEEVSLNKMAILGRLPFDIQQLTRGVYFEEFSKFIEINPDYYP